MVDDVAPAERRPLSIKVSPEAYANINAFCASQAITVSAFIESAAVNMLAKFLDEESDLSDGRAPALEEIVDAARQIDVERRRRAPS